MKTDLSLLRAKENRSEKITLRLTPKEKKLIDKKASQLNLTPSSYIRDRTLNGKEIRKKISQQKVYKTIMTLHNLDLLIQNLLYATNPSTHQQVLDNVNEIRMGVKEICR